MANPQETDNDHERRTVYAKCCTQAYSRYEYHPDACIQCPSPCQYGRRALELNGIDVKAGGESESHADWLTADKKVRRIIRAINKRRV